MAANIADQLGRSDDAKNLRATAEELRKIQTTELVKPGIIKVDLEHEPDKKSKFDTYLQDLRQTKTPDVENTQKSAQKTTPKPSQDGKNHGGLLEYVKSENAWKIIHEDEITIDEEENHTPIENIHFLSPKLKNGLIKYGISSLSKFQLDSVKTILGGKDVVISSPTASGKTEAFIIPIFQKILDGNITGQTYAVLVYPTIALSTDQTAKFKKLADACGLSLNAVAEFNSSVDEKTKEFFSENRPAILVTTFDTLHWGLAQKKIVGNLAKESKILVMDEAHSYCGFHGTNVHFVIKRLKKFAPNLQFVASSATLDNAEDFCRDLFEREMQLIEGTSRKKTIKRFVLYPRGVSQLTLMKNMTSATISNGFKSLCFSNTQRDAEIIQMELSDQRLASKNRSIRIKVHSGRILSDKRRLIENEMKTGFLDALSCTSTLEMGIDIGEIDAVISAFTSDLDNFVQRMGRAGRKGQTAYAFLVMDSKDAVSLYYSRNIHEYLSQKHICNVDKNNPVISENQNKFATYDLMAKNENAELIRHHLFRYNIRDIGKSIRIFHGNTYLASRNIPLAYYELFRGAVYLHGGQEYVSHGIFGDIAKVEPRRRSYSITQSNVSTSYGIKSVLQSRNVGLVKLSYCSLGTTSSISSYYLIPHADTAKAQLVELSSDDIIRWNHDCTGLKISGINTNLNNVHTLAHAIINAGCVVVKSEPTNLGEIPDPNSVVIYDDSPMGTNGFSKAIYENFERVITVAKNLLSECKCHLEQNSDANEFGGCPNCTFIRGYCYGRNEGLRKLDALKVLKELFP
jgi:DEAD/DEAH box helicase domain-containing protein